MEDYYAGSSAISSAITAIAVFSWIFIVIGVAVVAISAGEEIGTAVAFVGAGIAGLILKGVLKGIRAIVEAAELYMKNDREQKKALEEKAE